MSKTLKCVFFKFRSPECQQNPGIRKNNFGGLLSFRTPELKIHLYAFGMCVLHFFQQKTQKRMNGTFGIWNQENV